MSPRTQIQSVHRAATVLELVAGNGGMRASQIATRLDVPLPTVFHLLSTLTDVGLLDKLDDRRYQLGPMIGLLAEAFAAQVSAPEHLHARLQEMAERTGETAYLSAWRRGDATLLSIVEGRRAVRVSGLHLGLLRRDPRPRVGQGAADVQRPDGARRVPGAPRTDEPADGT